MRPGRFAAIPMLAALAACAAGPGPEVSTPAPPVPALFLHAPDPPRDGTLTALLPWDDPAFALLAERAIAGSPTLAEALSRVEQVRAGADRAGAERLPEIGAEASVSGTRASPAQFSAGLPPGIGFDSERVAYAANVIARWDADLFGRLRAQARAARARVVAADAAANGIRIALLSEIAATVIDWRTLRSRQASLELDLASTRELARLALVRERAGIAPGFDRVRADAAADASHSRTAAIASERARLIGRLVTLTAQDAAQVKAALDLRDSPGSPPPPVPSLPSDLLVNRPDVISAEATLRAEDAELAATVGRRFPGFGLSATIGLLAYGIGDVLDRESVIGSLAASIAGPLIDFGRISAEIDGAAAEKKAAFAAYRRAVYTALGDAEAAYGLVEAADDEAAAAEREASREAQAAEIAASRYRAGLDNFLAVLDARRAAAASGERAAAAHGRAYRARILLWQALGGGANGR